VRDVLIKQGKFLKKGEQQKRKKQQHKSRVNRQHLWAEKARKSKGKRGERDGGRLWGKEIGGVKNSRAKITLRIPKKGVRPLQKGGEPRKKFERGKAATITKPSHGGKRKGGKFRTRERKRPPNKNSCVVKSTFLTTQKAKKDQEDWKLRMHRGVVLYKTKKLRGKKE